ncbi:hypothetical protein CBOM_03382 [Ceraceosorus bombacis]|uniref:Uncharacterized protein n=1 Tax=Ceraceosorus bombacis TaxID=401625 RepID=A0A0P1BLP5_9BASI|nr:hypothetical protein CBOM_03382 [Ceraceosorus bombacis]
MVQATPAEAKDAPKAVGDGSKEAKPASSMEIQAAMQQLSQISALLSSPGALEAAAAAHGAPPPPPSDRPTRGLMHALPSLLAPLAALPPADAQSIAVPMPMGVPMVGAPNDFPPVIRLPAGQAALLARRAEFNPTDALGRAAELSRIASTPEAQAAFELVERLDKQRTKEQKIKDILDGRKRRAELKRK